LEEGKAEVMGQSGTRDRGKRFQANRKSPSKHQRGRGMGREQVEKKSILFRAYSPYSSY
jgi:hypothetical protein